MDLTAIKAAGAKFTASQQGAMYYARKRRRAREDATASEFKAKGTVLGVQMVVTLQAA